MRKRLFALFTCTALLLSLSSCGSGEAEWQPEKASAEIEPYAQRAIEIIDKYMAYDLTSEEANDAFDELTVRMIPLNVNVVDSQYSAPDQRIASLIDLLAIGSISNHTSTELCEYRDIFAFQIGEDVSGETYEAARAIIVGEAEDVAKFIDIDNAPFVYSTINQTPDYCHILVSFDTRNGVTTQDMRQCIESAFNGKKECNVQSFSFHITIGSYNQPVASIYIMDYGGTFIGNVQRSGATGNTESDELDYLYEFDSIEDLPEALAIVSAFIGIE